MTPKERVLTTFTRRAADRVPIDYSANPVIDERLKKHFGLALDDAEGLLRALGVDFRGVWAPYTAAPPHAEIPGRTVDMWGIRRRWIPNESGGYWEMCDFPLTEATEEQVAAWPMPNPDGFDYSGVRERCRQCGDFAMWVGGAGIGDIINGNGMLRSMEQSLIDLVTHDPAGLLLARRRTEINVEVLRRTLEAAQGAVDFLYIGEDLGTQIGPMISLELYRAHIRPLQQLFVDLAKSFGIPVMIHTCGSSSWAYDDFIEMGVTAVDTLQPEAVNMQPEYLKQRFGGRLAFHGCISTAGPVAYGTAEDTIAYCRRTLDIMMPGGGYCFAPTHRLQDNTPTENAVAMYQVAAEYGRYK